MNHRGQYPENWPLIADAVKDAAKWTCIRCGHAHDFKSGHVLTVHHMDGDKANVSWWNLLALCQRCHLKIQAKVDPARPYFLEHAEWFKVYAAGFYAKKYQFREITRAEAVKNLDVLLSLECLA